MIKRWEKLSTYLFLACLALLFTIGIASAQSAAIVTVAVSGNLVISQRTENLLIVDTLSGNIHNPALPQGSVLEPALNSTGTQIVYGRSFFDYTLLNLTAESYSEIEIFTGMPADDIFVPHGWSLRDNNILYMGNHAFFANDTFKTTYTFHLFDIASQSLTSIDFSLTSSELLPLSIPLPGGVTGAYLDGIDNVRRNPVYDEWIMLDLKTTDLASLSDPNNPNSSETIGELTLILLWNYATNEKLLVNNIVAERNFSNPLWSQDGRQISLERREGTYIFQFSPDDNPALSFVKNVPQQSEIISWLGVDDLLINYNINQQETDHIFTLAQIIEDEWYETEFFRLSSAYSGADSDWQLTASEQERYSLSCLFDQALPSRLEIGSQARVNFTDGTPLRLRIEPDFDAAEITQLPEGTEFTIVGGKACVNDSDYYRFWQLELADGTIGWAAEANTIEYFIEALPDSS